MLLLKIYQAVYVLANLANAQEAHQALILSNRDILLSLKTCLELKAGIRRPAVSCILELARNHPERRKDFNEAGIVSTLRYICDGSAGVSISPGSRSLHGHHSAMEDDKDIIDQARAALDWLHGDAYVS